MSASAQTSAVAQVILEGVSLPATKKDLISHARRNGGQAAGVMDALRRIPRREYAYLDQVGEAIAAVQPLFGQGSPAVPANESGAVPGGDAYLDATADPGWIRDSPEILAYEVELVRGPGGEQPKAGDPEPRPG